MVLHLLSFAVGAGAATLHDVTFGRQVQSFDLKTWNASLFDTYKRLIRVSLIWLSVSGLALYLPLARELNAEPLFIGKVVIFICLCLASAGLYGRVTPTLIYSLNSAEVSSKRQRQLGFGLSTLALGSWYGLVTLSVLRLDMPLGVVLGLYSSYAVFSAVTGYLAERRFSRRFQTTSERTLKEVAAELLEETDLSFLK